MAFQCYSLTLDGALQLASATAVSTATTTNGTALDLGGAANNWQRFAVVIDWSGLDVASGDELYRFQVQGATASAFSTPYVLAEKRLGADGSSPGPATGVNLQPVDTTALGRMVIYCDNVAVTSATDSSSIIATQFVRLTCVSSGTSPAVTFSAWIVPMP
jgi:hypothetical protein